MPKTTKKPKIRFGGLREKVKAGRISAQDVLKWARKQPNVSPAFLGWLARFDLDAHKKRAEEEKARKEKASKK